MTGGLWVTVQAGNFVGRLRSEDRQVDLAAAPTPIRAPTHRRQLARRAVLRSLQHEQDRPHRSATLAIREYQLAAAEARPRRIAIGRDDAVYYTDYAARHARAADPESGR